MMIYFIIAGAVIVWAINYMYLSGSERMDIDFNSDLNEILLISFLSFIGIPFILPGLLLLGIIKCILYVLDIIKGCVCGHWEDFVGWVELSWNEKKEVRKKKKIKKMALEEIKKGNIIIALKKEIRTLNARIDELNKYKREDIIEV